MDAAIRVGEVIWQVVRTGLQLNQPQPQQQQQLRQPPNNNRDELNQPQPQQQQQQQRPPNNNRDERWTSRHRNLSFYRNEIPSEPNGAKIDVILTTWYGDYEKLKSHQHYIQWLFPNKQPGANALAARLTDEEAMEIRSDPVLKRRFRAAFEMILDLYGMTLNDNNEFRLKDEDPHFLEHLINHSASRMWITRILNALKELGLKHLMLPWLKLLKKFIYEDQYLDERFAQSFNDFWMGTLDPADQDKLF